LGKRYFSKEDIQMDNKHRHTRKEKLTGALVHFWWESKMVWPLWKTRWQIPQRSNHGATI
jgi:hypothetical protein